MAAVKDVTRKIARSAMRVTASARMRAQDSIAIFSVCAARAMLWEAIASIIIRLGCGAGPACVDKLGGVFRESMPPQASDCAILRPSGQVWRTSCRHGATAPHLVPSGVRSAAACLKRA